MRWGICTIPASNSTACSCRIRPVPTPASAVNDGVGQADPTGAVDAGDPWPPEADAVWSV